MILTKARVSQAMPEEGDEREYWFAVLTWKVNITDEEYHEEVLCDEATVAKLPLEEAQHGIHLISFTSRGDAENALNRYLGTLQAGRKST